MVGPIDGSEAISQLDFAAIEKAFGDAATALRPLVAALVSRTSQDEQTAHPQISGRPAAVHLHAADCAQAIAG